MYNDLVFARLNTCLEHIETIEKYTDNASSAEAFFKLNGGANYDASLMRLQALGERLKTISQNHPFVINDLNYPEINNVIRFRDYVSHHYEQLEHESIYEICFCKIPELKRYLLTLLKNKP
jgi:uncharacterized protein with HEPN domain